MHERTDIEPEKTSETTGVERGAAATSESGRGGPGRGRVLKPGGAPRGDPRGGQPGVGAGSAIWLARADSSDVTGQTIVVDGGGRASARQPGAGLLGAQR